MFVLKIAAKILINFKFSNIFSKSSTSFVKFLKVKSSESLCLLYSIMRQKYQRKSRRIVTVKLIILYIKKQ